VESRPSGRSSRVLPIPSLVPPPAPRSVYLAWVLGLRRVSSLWPTCRVLPSPSLVPPPAMPIRISCPASSYPSPASRRKRLESRRRSTLCNPMESCAPWYGSGGTERGALSRCCPSGSAILTSADKMESCPLDVGPPQAPASPRRRVVPGQGPFHTFPAESSTATASSFVLAAANLTHVLPCVPVYP
jgi:hypothetical protein